jgi:hypothetical protein
MRGVEIVLSGTAEVYCIHDRRKRQVKTPDDCMRIARAAGLTVIPAHPKFQTCGCCENVFASYSDEPQLCHKCSGENVHSLGGPINDPIEGVL